MKGEGRETDEGREAWMARGEGREMKGKGMER